MTQSLHHRIALVQETGAFGTIPTTPILWKLEGGPTSPSINAPKQISTTIRNDGNVKQSTPLNRSAAFTRSQEMVYPTVSQGLWNEIRAGLRTTESAAISSGTNGDTSSDVLATTGSNTITRGAGSFITDGYQPNEIIKLTNSSDDGYYRITSVAATVLGLEVPDSGTLTVDADVDIERGAVMVNGTTNYSYAIEESWLDAVASYPMITWVGQRVGSVSWSFQVGSRSEVSISYIGKDGTPGTMSDGANGVGFTSATYTDYTESPVMGPTESVTAVIADETLPLSSVSITVSNGARVRHSLEGGATPEAAPTGVFRCTLSVSAYASVLSTLTQHRAGTEVATWFVFEDPDGKAISFSMGTVMWDSATLPTGGVDQDAIITATGTATLTPAADANDQNATLRFQRFE